MHLEPPPTASAAHHANETTVLQTMPLDITTLKAAGVDVSSIEAKLPLISKLTAREILDSRGNPVRCPWLTAPLLTCVSPRHVEQQHVSVVRACHACEVCSTWLSRAPPTRQARPLPSLLSPDVSDCMYRLLRWISSRRVA